MSYLLRRSILLLACSALTFAGNFQTPTNYQTNPYPTGIVSGDFNRDGNTDLVMTVCGDKNCVAPGSVQVLLGHGNGKFSLGGVFAAGVLGTSVDTLASGDFNGDGTPDLVVVTNAINKFGNVNVLIADGSGGFLPPVGYPVGGSTPVWAAVADFNGDHKLDLAISVTTTNSVAVLQGNGDGTFRPAVNYDVENAPQGITVGDVNGDGIPDIIAANQCGLDPACRLGTVSVLLGNGNGTFQPELGFPAGMFPLSVALADFDGDGHPDLAVAQPCGADPTCVSNGAVGILLGNGDGTFQPFVSYLSTGLNTVRLTVGDFNGDHYSDVVALNAQATDITVFLGSGDGTLQPGIDYTVGLVPIWAVVADFNRDRAPDLAVANEFGFDVSVLLNSGGTKMSLTSTPNPSRVGQTVTFTVTVAATLSGYGTPTGTVTFTSGGKTLGTAPLVGGTAAVMSANLPVGRNVVRANYSGDAQYNPNISAPLAQTVKP
jgi:Big-like domain-containing protein/VCBS repeat protein